LVAPSTTTTGPASPQGHCFSPPTPQPNPARVTLGPHSVCHPFPTTDSSDQVGWVAPNPSEASLLYKISLFWLYFSLNLFEALGLFKFSLYSRQINSILNLFHLKFFSTSFRASLVVRRTPLITPPLISAGGALKNLVVTSAHIPPHVPRPCSRLFSSGHSYMCVVVKVYSR